MRTESSIHAAADRLYTAVSKLVDEQKQWLDGELHVAPSLYVQLLDAVAAVSRRDGYARGVGRSIAPVWPDALDLKADVDSTVREWLPDAKSDTVSRLGVLATKKWGLDSTQAVESMAGRVEAWTAAVSTLLAPERPKTISAPCPACNATHVYRKDSVGERVRVPALQITTAGCTCLACGHVWAPEYFLHLAKVLGYETPTGVLE